MTKIFFVNTNGSAPHLDETLRGLCNIHLWAPDEATYAYGCAMVNPREDPTDVADALTDFGLTVLPGVHDDAAVPDAVADLLSHHGVKRGHKTKDVGKLLYAASGCKWARPNLF